VFIFIAFILGCAGVDVLLIVRRFFVIRLLVFRGVRVVISSFRHSVDYTRRVVASKFGKITITNQIQ